MGTKQELLAKQYILEQIHRYKDAAANNVNVPIFEVESQMADGAHEFIFMDEGLFLLTFFLFRTWSITE